MTDRLLPASAENPENGAEGRSIALEVLAIAVVPPNCYADEFFDLLDGLGEG